MANTIKIGGTHLALFVCLPVAILVGYLLSDPLQLTSISIIALLMGLLAMPLVIKWHYLLLIFSCNAIFQFSFLPGTPPLWLLATVIGFGMAVLNRCIDSKRPLVVGGSVAHSLLAIGIVVIVTAYLRGGAGLAAFGGSSYGGKKYIYLLGAIAAYFALASQRMPESRRLFYVTLFFAAGATSIFSFLVDYGGSKFAFLDKVVPPDFDTEVEIGSARLFFLAGIGSAGVFTLIVRYGVRGIFERYWRLGLLALFLFGSLLTGFRSAFGLLAIFFLCALFLEGLHRTRYFFMIIGCGLVVFLFLALFAQQLPWQVQRTISFLPIRIDPLVKLDAKGSVDWRVEMWKVVLPEVPQYLWEGKGYALDPGGMYMSQINSYTQLATDSSEWAVYSGDYHNGPLSLIIPFGIWGVIVFLWFLWATGKMLYANYTRGDPRLKTINTTIFALFIAKVILFFFLFGSFFSDLLGITSLAGLAVSLNGGHGHAPVRELSPIFTLATQRIAKDL